MQTEYAIFKSLRFQKLDKHNVFSFIVWLEPKCPKFLTKILKNRNYYNLGERL